MFSDNPRVRQTIKNFDRASRAKLARIDKQKSAEQAKRRGEADHILELQDRARDLQVTIGRMEEDREHYSSKFGPEHEAALKEAREELAELKKTIAEAHAALNRQMPTPSRLNWLFEWTAGGDLDDFLQHQPPQARYQSAPADVKPLKPEVLPKALADSRARQEGFVAEVETTKRRPPDMATMLGGLDREVERMAKAGKPDVRGLARWGVIDPGLPERQGVIAWPIGQEADFRLTKATSGQLGVSMLCWLFKDQVKAALAAEIRSRFGEGGLSATERSKKIAELTAALLAEQRVFERLACMAEDAGIAVERPLLHPLARLEIVRIDDAPMPKRQEPEYPIVADIGAGTSGTPITPDQAKGWTAPQR